MKIYFGTDLDDRVYPQPRIEIGSLYCGINGLLVFLEQKCGIAPPLANVEHLRVEQYRQALARYIEQVPTVFYAASFVADAFGVAESLLERRDILPDYQEYIKAKEQFDLVPERLKVLFAIEKLIEDDPFLSLHKGFADRLRQVKIELEHIQIDIDEIVFNEPFHLLPFELQSLFTLIFSKNKNCKKNDINALKESSKAEAHTKLAVFQRRLLRESVEKTVTPDDDSLLIIEAERETDAADFLANLFKNNPQFKPLLLIPERNRILDTVFEQEGLPTLGIESASLARPTLQLLKLASTFLWQPIDPFKIMEFLTLPVKPLRDDLAVQLATLMANAPGINSDKWYAKVETYFEELPQKLENETSILGKTVQDRATTARKLYTYWFGRRRYALNRRVPKSEALDVYTKLRQWALEAFKENGNIQSSLLVLAEQAKRVVELLEELPERERDLSFLQLEQLVRTVYASSPIMLNETQIGSLPFIHTESAVISSVKNVVWWNFCTRQNDHYFNKWYKEEVAFLAKCGVEIDLPQKQATLRQWQRNRPVLNCSERLILIIPKKIDGERVLEHPLMGELKATFSDYKKMVYTIDTPGNREILRLKLTEKEVLSNKKLTGAPPHLQVASAQRLVKMKDEEKLYYTPLDNLLNYPHSYIFTQKLELRQSSILSVVDDHVLKGNLAHRIFEQILPIEQTFQTYDDLLEWFNRRIFTVMQQEGAVLMMYGREPERQQFEELLRRSIWVFLTAIRENKWQVKGVEVELNGQFCGLKAAGRCDVLLANDKGDHCIVDLKWSGTTRRRDMIRNGKDLQLVLYSKLLMQQEGRPDDWAHTAFFIIEKGQFVARNAAAFAEALTPVNTETNHELANNNTYKKMEYTFLWRVKQLKEGKVEIRTSQNMVALSELYEDEAAELFACLELPTESNPYDNFATLIQGYE